MENANIEYVSDAVYDKVAQESQSTQIQWVGIKLGNASGWEIGRLDLFKSLNVEVKTFHSSLLQDQDKPLQFSRKIERSPPGPGKTITIQPPEGHQTIFEGYSNGKRSYGANFSGTSVVLPADASVADTILLEIYERDLFFDHLLGQIAIRYDDPQATDMRQYTVYTADGNSTLEVQLEFYNDDSSVETDLGGSPAQCKWFEILNGKPLDEMCGRPRFSPTCESFLRDATQGATYFGTGY